MVHLSREHKIAVARIIADLIEADFVVDNCEMDFFEHIISKQCLSISDAMLIEAKKIDLSKALSMLNDLCENDCRYIVGLLKKLALSDGECVPFEAVFIYAIEQVLLHKATMHSVPYPQVDIENLKVIYIESENTQVGQYINRVLPSISGQLRLGGFEFIYIPSLVEDFRRMGLEYLCKAIKYKMPSISEERILKICKHIRELSTHRFCRDHLHKKIGLDIVDCKPSLLIKVNDSDIIDKYDAEETERIRFSNFLQVQLCDNIEAKVGDMVEAISSMVSCPIMAENRPRTSKFIYLGFHKSLFDLIAYGRESKECRLVFEMSEHKVFVYFESIESAVDRVALKLNPQETALYYMIVQKSLSGEGLDWREHITSEQKNSILAEYNHIYTKISKGNKVLEYKDRTQVHHIKNRIRLLREISNIGIFIPEHVKSGAESYYRIRAKAKDVVIKEYTTL